MPSPCLTSFSDSLLLSEQFEQLTWFYNSQPYSSNSLQGDYILTPWKIMFLPTSIPSHTPLTSAWNIVHLPNTCFRLSLEISSSGRHSFSTRRGPNTLQGATWGPQASLIVAFKAYCSCPVKGPIRDKLYNELPSFLCIPILGDWERSHSTHLLYFVVQMRTPVREDYKLCDRGTSTCPVHSCCCPQQLAHCKYSVNAVPSQRST